MKRAFIIMLLGGFSLWLAGCDVVDTHYVGRGRGFYTPPPVIVHSRPAYSHRPVAVHRGPVYSPRGHYRGGHGGGQGRRW